MIFREFLKFKKSLLFCAALFGAVLAFEVSAFTGTYSHYSDKEKISSVLVDFARTQKLKAQVSEGIKGVISGRFERVNPKLFLDGLNAAFGVNYYISGDTIYFYNDSEWTSSVFRPSSVGAYELIDTLQKSGLIVSALPIVVDGSGFMTIKGPSYYVDNIITQAGFIDNSVADKYIMRVFKLKHAKADDIQITSMDKTVVVPGIASILQRMVTGGGHGAKTTVSINRATVPGLLGTGLSSVGASAPSVPSALNNTSTSPVMGPSIIADSRLNAVIIQDASYRMPYYEEVITQLDIPVQLVELHAAIVDVDADASRNLGIDWRGSRKKGKLDAQIGVGNVQMGSDGFPVRPDAGGIFSTIFHTAHSTIMMDLNLLEEQNKARTLGRPSVLTLDNVEATLEDTTTRYVPVAGKEVSDLFKVESGTVLRVTPHIIHDDDGSRLIQMVISLQSNQDSNDNSLSTPQSGSAVPPIKQTRINTQAVVREGQSLLLGGYYVEYKRAGDSGVPVLKDVPVAGTLFGSEGDESFRRERLLMITPRILSLDDINVPPDVDEPAFTKSPTQSDYTNRIVKRQDDGGCSSNRNATGRAVSAAGGTDAGSTVVP